MIVKEEFLSRLRRYFNLNLYEVKIWTALLSRGVSTAGELSDIANVPRSRSYDVLESLEKKGFVVMKIGKPIKYLAVPPKEVLERVKKKITEKAEEHLSEIEKKSFVKHIDSLQEVYESNQTPSEVVVAVLRGNGNIEKHLSHLIKNAQKDVVVVGKGSDTQPLFEPGKGVSVTKSKQDMRVHIIDENIVLFPMAKDEVHPDFDVGVWLKHEETSNFLKQLVE